MKYSRTNIKVQNQGFMNYQINIHNFIIFCMKELGYLKCQIKIMSHFVSIVIKSREAFGFL